ncbi:MAG: PIN domain-containing protein [Acidobacteriota bacterium]|jgi:predicted nucleic acid-binding protein|nr:PIN domain-containing protein [Acidobacteriota bacterium]
MKRVFADTSYWIAISWKSDQWREQAFAASEKIGNAEIVTTETVLIEVLNYFSEFDGYAKQKIVLSVETILQDENVLVLHHNHEDFLKALELYKSRLDKGYSLTDCISMNAMRGFSIADVLTNDEHFEQEGFTKLF